MIFLEVLHFGRSLEVNNYLQLLLSCVHKGFLWLDTAVSIDSNMITKIKRILIVREDLTHLIKNNK